MCYNYQKFCAAAAEYYGRALGSFIITQVARQLKQTGPQKRRRVDAKKEKDRPDGRGQGGQKDKAKRVLTERSSVF